MTRRYRLGRRAETAEETRRRIVEATFALHAEHGVAATTMKQIAARAGVSPGTVYHHFPTYDDAIHACGAFSQETVPLPTAAVFDGIAERSRRVERLARAVFDYYRRLPAYEHVRNDQHLVPLLRKYVALERRRRRALVRAAIGGHNRDPRIGTVMALLDVGVFRSLAADGLSAAAAAARVAAVINAWLASPAPRR